MTRFSILIFSGMLPVFGFAQAQGDLSRLPSTCNQITLTHPEIGAAYRGRVLNDDYHFSAQLPRGLTGWSGTPDSAPFHGFTVFWASDNSTCIVFEVHMRVDEENVPHHPVEAKPLYLGQAAAWQVAIKGKRSGIELENVVTSFSFNQPDQTDDGTVTLVTNARDKARNLRIYNEFLNSLKFGK